MKYVNPITDNIDYIVCNYPNVDYSYWIHTQNYTNEKELCEILDYIIKDLDCTKTYYNKRVLSVDSINYKKRLNDFYYYCIKIKNQFVYNQYLDKFIQRHIDNIVFEYNNPIIIEPKSKTKRKTAKRSIPNKYVRHVTKDLFSGETLYEYANLKTGDVIISKDENLLDELNKPKNKTKAKIGVPISAMTFNFKKK